MLIAPRKATRLHAGDDGTVRSQLWEGHRGPDLVYFAKVEHERTTNHQDRAVQVGDVTKGQAKACPQTHIHVIVSRTENLVRYTERKQAGELERKNPYHLSPLTNHKNTQRGVVTGGFERKQYSERVEQTFAYERPLTETFKYAHTMQHGTPEECAALRVQVIQEQQRQADRQAVEQRHQVAALAPKQRSVNASAQEQQTAIRPEQEPPRVIKQRDRGINRGGALVSNHVLLNQLSDCKEWLKTSEHIRQEVATEHRRAIAYISESNSINPS